MPKTLEKGDMLPVAELRRVPDGPSVKIGSNRPKPQVLVITHADSCKDCLRYLESFEEVTESFKNEKTDVFALVTSDWENDASSLPVDAVIAEGRIREKLSPDSSPVVAVVDRYGQIFDRVDAGEDHAFPEHDKVLGTLVDMAIRCPECGVPDVPSADFLPEEGTRSGGMALGQ